MWRETLLKRLAACRTSAGADPVTERISHSACGKKRASKQHEHAWVDGARAQIGHRGMICEPKDARLH